MTGVRIDRWLWAARFFKTRSLAAQACGLGRILSNAKLAKAAREVRVGDVLQVKNAGGEYEVEVLLLSETRGPAPVAQTLYRETERSRELRLKAAQERREAPRWDAWPEGRPQRVRAALTDVPGRPARQGRVPADSEAIEAGGSLGSNGCASRRCRMSFLP
jgi:ribosome-associated heat shock protein Hsp15